MAGGGELHITLSDEAVQRLRAAMPGGRGSIERKAGEVIIRWLDEQAEKAQDEADGKEALKVLKRIKAGKEKAIPAAEVYARLGI